MFQNVHPDHGRPVPVPSKAVNYGRNAENVAYQDNRYVRCSKCGFMCHLDRDARASRGSRVGDGISYSTDEGGWGDDPWGNDWGGSGADTDPVVQSGCPFCGSLLYAS